MNHAQAQLLLCLKAYRLGEGTAERTEENSPEFWEQLHELAAVHSVIPVVYETLRGHPDFPSAGSELAGTWRREALFQAAAQAGRTQMLLRLTGALNGEGIPYAVVKGAVCRALYSRPDLRPSGDEDLFIPAGARERCSAVLDRCGLVLTSSGEGVDHWIHGGTGLHVEVHTRLFSTGWRAEPILNQWFDRALGRTVTTLVEGAEVRTLAPTDHFLFLVSHGVKHFIAGGLGVRAWCDILTFEENYRDEICRKTVDELLNDVGGREFFLRLLAMGQALLSWENRGWTLPQREDWGELLDDMMEAGVYGQTSMERRHSAALALRAAGTGGEQPSPLAVLFPPARKLAGRYPILRRVPILLPVMWVRRILTYLWEVLRSGGEGNSPGETLALGKKRTEMMVRYGILSQDKREDR